MESLFVFYPTSKIEIIQNKNLKTDFKKIQFLTLSEIRLNYSLKAFKLDDLFNLEIRPYYYSNIIRQNEDSKERSCCSNFFTLKTEDPYLESFNIKVFTCFLPPQLSYLIYEKQKSKTPLQGKIIKQENSYLLELQNPLDFESFDTFTDKLIKENNEQNPTKGSEKVQSENANYNQRKGGQSPKIKQNETFSDKVKKNKIPIYIITGVVTIGIIVGIAVPLSKKK